MKFIQFFQRVIASERQRAKQSFVIKIASSPSGRLRFALLSGFALLAMTQCSLVFAQSPNYIRVAIIQDVSSFRLKIKGFYEVINLKDGQSLSRGKNLNTTVELCKYGILLGRLEANTSKLVIKPEAQDAIIINGRRFRGNIQIIRNNSDKLAVINQIELEDYIKGILYHEVSHFWPMEALKAQAIVCRSYALYQAQENKAKDYDLTADIYSQVYGGSTSERYRTNEAVMETRGTVLEYENRIFPAYYHATCGGHTEDAAELWNINIVPLRGVACNYCKDSPHSAWHYVLSLVEIKDKLDGAGFKLIGDIKDIRIAGRNKSGRVTNLEIESLQKKVIISVKDFRNIIGPNIIKSTNFSINIVEGDAVFEGWGWGHGVGMCQWGAYFMAKSGKTYEEILKYYYPGAVISLIVNR